MITDLQKEIDPWTAWQPQWIGENNTPHDRQEKHSPTEQLDGQQQSRRRIVDARLWEAMTFVQQAAAIEIAMAFEMVSRGLGYAANNWQRIPGCRGASSIAEVHARQMNLYIDWATHCAKRKISHAMVVDVLCFGFPCALIDRDRRLKNGSTRENLMRGLSLYSQRRGWEVDAYSSS